MAGTDIKDVASTRAKNEKMTLVGVVIQNFFRKPCSIKGLEAVNKQYLR